MVAYGERKIRNRMRHARISEIYEDLKGEALYPIKIISWDFTIVGPNEDEILFVVYEVAAHDYDDLHFDEDYRWAVYFNGKRRAGG